MGIGIATGRAVAGKIGTVDQVKVTVFGPVVNLASRLEGMTKILQAPILLDERTAAARPQSAFRRKWPGVRRVAIVKPYGMDKPLEVIELLPPVERVSAAQRRERGRLRTGLDELLAGRWPKAFERVAPRPADDRVKDFLDGLHRPAQSHPARGLERRDPADE